MRAAFKDYILVELKLEVPRPERLLEPGDKIYDPGLRMVADDGLSGPRHLFTASSRETEKSYEHPEWGTSIFTGLYACGVQGPRATRWNCRIATASATPTHTADAPSTSG